jgi:hypothetical protein
VARYDTIGLGYSRTRREDPRFRARIHAALAEARSVVNVGAGTGAYEPRDRHATSGFARMPTNVVDRVVSEVSRDLASGLWDDRHGHLRSLDELDVGLRLIVAA